MKRIAIAGAGNMARARGRAFLDSGAQICSVAARHEASARACAAELDCSCYYDDYRRLAENGPDAILIETPHKIQDEIALWALDAGFDVLIGGCLASGLEQGQQIVDRAQQRGRGFQPARGPAPAAVDRVSAPARAPEPRSRAGR